MLVTAASLFILGTTLYNYREGLNIEISRVRSEVDGKTYLVQNTLDKQEAADQLAYLRQRMKQLKEHIREKHRKRKIPSRNKEACLRLIQQFQEDEICENSANSEHTSYTVNKGERIHFCLRQRGERNEFVDLNTLTFVSLHELAHIMSSSIGHTSEFWDNFRFLLHESIQIGIYHYEDYRVTPKRYCGTTITDSPYHP